MEGKWQLCKSAWSRRSSKTDYVRRRVAREASRTSVNILKEWKASATAMEETGYTTGGSAPEALWKQKWNRNSGNRKEISTKVLLMLCGKLQGQMKESSLVIAQDTIFGRHHKHNTVKAASGCVAASQQLVLEGKCKSRRTIRFIPQEPEGDSVLWLWLKVHLLNTDVERVNIYAHSPLAWSLLINCHFAVMFLICCYFCQNTS